MLVQCGVTAAQVREKRIVPLDPTQRQGFETCRRAGVAILVGGLTDVWMPSG